jgi:hypothetical protein
MRQLVAIILLVGAGGGIAAADDVPFPRPRPAAMTPATTTWSEPHSFREAAGEDFDTSAVTARLTDCDTRLKSIAVIEPMPRLIGPGACGGGDLVQVDAVLLDGNKRIEMKAAPLLQCPMAEQLALWLRDQAAPRVAKAGPALVSVETADDFECRGRNRQINGKISEHGKANAIDVRGFTLANGSFIALTDINAAKDLRDDLRESACGRFTTVLGPGSDGYHEEHIHLDLLQRHNGYRICQWEVRVPPPPKPEVATVAAGEPVPLPPPRPHVSVDSRKL